MTRSNRGLFSIVSILTLLLASAVSAAVPQVISYQGRLTDNVGDPLADGMYLVKFSIYDAAAAGTVLWSSGFQNISTQDGLFSYDLGSDVQLPDNIFEDTVRYLGITVGVDPELSPRTRLESVPYAYQAHRSDDAAGVTLNIEEGNSILTAFLNILASDSIYCPTDGYVMLNLTVGLNCDHTNGQTEGLFLLLVDSTLTITQDMDNRAWSLASALPSAIYNVITGAHKVFPVSAGWNKFMALVSHQNLDGGADNCGSSDVAMSLLFIPNAYGTVEEGIPTSPTSELNNLPIKTQNK